MDTVFEMLVDEVLQKPELWDVQQDIVHDSGGVNVLLRQVTRGGNRSDDNQCCLIK